ncbi:MAG TPA: exonuclease domain-containing protein [Candidatus Binataceae bacterium]|nr:exonuclease domain-containing protein [Candidatus Binataceae bacterium]
MLKRSCDEGDGARWMQDHRVSGGSSELSAEPGDPHATVREKLYAFLEAHPGGADANELAGLLLKGIASDTELGAQLVYRLLGGDPNFAFDAASGMWSLKSSDRYRVALDEAPFTVVDLETTGGRAGPGTIIEIGAYRMIGRRLVDSFSSLVRPHGMIPRFITGLTSITNEMVATAPPIESVLPAFREFMGDSVMVAHNAAFDRGFLDFEFRRIFGMGLRNPVLCTLRMSRRLVPSLKRRRLDSLAEHFGLATDGRHRGLGDARMAAEILSIFLEIAAKMGITRLDRLLDDHGRGLSGRRFERHVAPEEIAAIPHAPGVYLMRNARGDILYIGKARRLRDRVGSYFTAAVNAKTAELISHVYKIDTRLTASALEAGLLEARMIRELKPPYNRMLKSAAPAYFIKLDMMDDFPRIVLTTKMTARAGVMHLGPFIGRKSLDGSVRALARILGLRTCTGKLHPDEDFSPCIYGQMGQCTAPCNASIDEDAYAERVRKALGFLRGRSGALLGDLARARDDAAKALRYEEAGRMRRDLEALATLARRASRLSEVVTENNLVIITGEAGARTAHVVLAGRLALTRALDSPDAAGEVAAFVADNFERYRARPVVRGELEAMTIVARWLRERASDEGRLIYLSEARLDPAALSPANFPRTT